MSDIGWLGWFLIGVCVGVSASALALYVAMTWPIKGQTLKVRRSRRKERV